MSELARFWSKVDVRGPDECWPWRGGTNERGYGRFCLDRNGRRLRIALAHRYAYTATVGPIPAGKILHHRCETPGCVNPQHVRPVARGEHTVAIHGFHVSNGNAERTHCKRGHPFAGENLITERNGNRRCRTCNVLKRERANAARRAKSTHRTAKR